MSVPNFPQRGAAIVGVYTTAQARSLDRTSFSLQLEAIKGALADAGLTTDDVDGVVPMQMAEDGGLWPEQFWAAQFGGRPSDLRRAGFADPERGQGGARHLGRVRQRRGCVLGQGRLAHRPRRHRRPRLRPARPPVGLRHRRRRVRPVVCPVGAALHARVRHLQRRPGPGRRDAPLPRDAQPRIGDGQPRRADDRRRRQLAHGREPPAPVRLRARHRRRLRHGHRLRRGRSQHQAQAGLDHRRRRVNAHRLLHDG